MTDYFALLGTPRRPWLDLEVLRADFLALCAEAHPDRSSSPEAKGTAHDRFAELNAAYNCLRNPKERLRHLLELERGATVPQLDRVDDASANDLFFQLGRVCKEVDQFLSERSRVTSPLLRARLFEQGLTWTEELTQRRDELQQRATKLEAEIAALNPAWEGAPGLGTEARPGALPLDQLKRIYRQYSFVARWLEQVRERIVQLAM